jgi:FdrA protein
MAMRNERARLTKESTMSDKIHATLLDQPLKVINVGLDGFAEELERQGVAVVRLDWQPPAGGDPKLADLLSKLGA